MWERKDVWGYVTCEAVSFDALLVSTPRSLSNPLQWLRSLSQSYTWKLLAMVACTNHLLKVGLGRQKRARKGLSIKHCDHVQGERKADCRVCFL